MAWVCKVCRWSLVPRPSSRPFMSRRAFNTNSNLSLLAKNYMIPTIRVEADVQAVAKNLENKVRQAPLFYKNAPVVLDFEASEGSMESNKIVTLFNEITKLNLIPVGITFTHDPIIQDMAKQYNIPLINSTRPAALRTFPSESSHLHSPRPSSPNLNTPQKPEKVLIRSFSNTTQQAEPSTPSPPPSLHSHDHPPTPPIQLATSHGPPPQLYPPPISSANISSFPSSPSPSRVPSPSPLPSPTAPHPTVDIESVNSDGVPPLIIKSSLRSGQQVYARNGADLIVMGSVHSGAEALADGNIHIYGSLKGRALAGVSGNMDAKIFSGKFHAELISIADTYCACEEQPPGTDPNKPSVVWLEQGNLKFSTMD